MVSSELIEPCLRRVLKYKVEAFCAQHVGTARWLQHLAIDVQRE